MELIFDKNYDVYFKTLYPQKEHYLKIEIDLKDIKNILNNLEFNYGNTKRIRETGSKM